MRKMLSISICFVVTILFGFGSMLFAQSSGNFSATAIPATCVIGTTGALTGGAGITLWTSKISTSNGNGVTLKITPSVVTGLFTRKKIATSVATASTDMGIQVCVEVDGSGNGILPKSCVVYDQRFQQVSSKLFSQIAECNTVICTTTDDCTAAGLSNGSCINATGLTGGGVCVVPTENTCTTTADCQTGQICIIPEENTEGACNQVAGEANGSCDFESVASTLSAHSFDFVVPVGKQKSHTVTARWEVVGTGNVGDASKAYCLGPGILTVEQVKVFNNSGALLKY